MKKHMLNDVIDWFDFDAVFSDEIDIEVTVRVVFLSIEISK